jgi:hypothetical protein
MLRCFFNVIQNIYKNKNIKLDPRFKDKLMSQNLNLYKGFEIYDKNMKKQRKAGHSRTESSGNKTFMITQIIKS